MTLSKSRFSTFRVADLVIFFSFVAACSLKLAFMNVLQGDNHIVHIRNQSSILIDYVAYVEAN